MMGRRAAIAILTPLLGLACSTHVASTPLSAPAAPVVEVTRQEAAPPPATQPQPAPNKIDGLQRACDLGGQRACNELGVELLNGDNVPVDDERAARVLQRGCDLKFPAACMNLGFAFAEGRGVEKDEARAERYYEFACQRKVGAACNALGRLLDAKPNRDEDVMLGYYEQACDLGDKNGCVNAAFEYADDAFEHHDAGKALRLYTESCDADNGAGCAGEAAMLLRAGTATDLTSAARLYEKACGLDPYWGCYEYGLALSDGSLGERDMERASTLLTKSCKAKQERACNLLEEMTPSE